MLIFTYSKVPPFKNICFVKLNVQNQTMPQEKSNKLNDVAQSSTQLYAPKL